MAKKMTPLEKEIYDLLVKEKFFGDKRYFAGVIAKFHEQKIKGQSLLAWLKESEERYGKS